MAKKKNLYDNLNQPYQQTAYLTNRRQEANNIQQTLKPESNPNPFYKQVKSTYDSIKNGKGRYNQLNDAVYKSIASIYKDLGTQAINDTNAVSQGLTGGYGSTYSPYIMDQTSMRDNLDQLQPAFEDMQYQLEQGRQNMALNQMQAANQQASDFNEQKNEAWQNFINGYGIYAGQTNEDEARAMQRYADSRKSWIDQYWNEVNENHKRQDINQQGRWNANRLKQDQREFDGNLKLTTTENKRDEYWANNSVNIDIATNNAKSYADAGDNAGMKAYLNGLVKSGEITQYQADKIYEAENNVAEVAHLEASKFHDKQDNAGLESYLKKLVANGDLTQFEADKIYQTYKYTAPKSKSPKKKEDDDNTILDDMIEKINGEDVDLNFSGDNVTQNWREIRREDYDSDESYQNALSRDLENMALAYENGTITADEFAYMLRYYGVV